MRTKALSLVVVAMAMTAALGTGQAFGSATTEPKQWYTGTTEAGVTTLPAGTTKAVTAEVAEHNATLGKKFTLGTTIGTNNLRLDITASGVECEGCTIENKTVGSSVVATGKGKLLFTGVTVMEPTGCKVKEEKILTNNLTFEAHYMEGSKWLWRIKPETGELLATITLESVTTGSCQVAGPYLLKTAELFAEARNQTSVFKTAQEVIFSPTINTLAGGNLYLTSSSHPAELTGTTIARIGGLYFGVK